MNSRYSSSSPKNQHSNRSSINSNWLKCHSLSQPSMLTSPSDQSSLWTRWRKVFVIVIDPRKCNNHYSEGSWPTLEYTKCSNFNGQPVIRVLDLKAALASSNVKSTVLLDKFVFKSNLPQNYIPQGHPDLERQWAISFKNPGNLYSLEI